jgi:hypothetical protein
MQPHINDNYVPLVDVFKYLPNYIIVVQLVCKRWREYARNMPINRMARVVYYITCPNYLCGGISISKMNDIAIPQDDIAAILKDPELSMDYALLLRLISHLTVVQNDVSKIRAIYEYCPQFVLNLHSSGIVRINGRYPFISIEPTERCKYIVYAVSHCNVGDELRRVLIQKNIVGLDYTYTPPNPMTVNFGTIEDYYGDTFM